MFALSSDLHDLGAALRDGRTTPTDLLEAHIRRVRQVDGALNGLAVDRFEAAREEARRASAEFSAGEIRGPLHGIPCTVKEFIAVEGMPHTGGLYVRRNIRASRDATLVTRLKDAGAVVFGTTNAPEGGLWHETHNPVYGRTSNPHDIDRTSGGSSGGEGALIASGASPFGIGSDVGGSIRLPAGFCGIYGHKPTHSLVPSTGHFPPAPPEPFMTCGPMTRSARDLMPILEVIAGPDPLDSQSRPWTLGRPEDVHDLDVLVLPTNGQASVSPAMQGAVLEAADLLASRGARIRPVQVPELARAFDIWAALMGDQGLRYDELVSDGGRVPLFRELGRWTRGRSRHTGSVLAMIGLDRMMALLPNRAPAMRKVAEELATRLDALLGDGAVLLHPTFARVAPHHRTIALGNPADIGLTAIFNILGLPVSIAPIGQHDGVPTSVQIIGARGRDHRTIAAAIELEAATGGWTPVDPRRRGGRRPGWLR